MKKKFSSFLLLICFFSTSLTITFADEMDSLKARFLERKGTVAGLLQSGKAGENNKGFLEARGSLNGDEQAVLQAENGDRQHVYNAIAKKKWNRSQSSRSHTSSTTRRATPWGDLLPRWLWELAKEVSLI